MSEIKNLKNFKSFATDDEWIAELGSQYPNIKADWKNDNSTEGFEVQHHMIDARFHFQMRKAKEDALAALPLLLVGLVIWGLWALGSYLMEVLS